jgi:hypothetical protein
MRRNKLKFILAFPSNTAIFFIIIFFMGDAIFAQTEKEIVNIFKTKVDSLENCVSNIKWLLKDIKYDVKKTESLIIPIQGEIKLTAIQSDFIDNLYTTFPVIVKLYWSEDKKYWVVEKVLAKSLGVARDKPWSEPEKDFGWRYPNRPGYKMEDLISALRDHFSSK